MKTKKVKLTELKIKSFVTSADKLTGGKKKDNPFFTREAECPVITKKSDVFDCDFTRHTFMKPDTGGCQHTDIGCPDIPTPKL